MARRHKVRRLVFIFSILAAVSFPVFATEPVGNAPSGLSGNVPEEKRTSFAAKGAVAQRFRTAKNCVLFYGTPNETTMENLSTYDIVVLEPQALGSNAKARIAALRATGTIVIGYMSFFEVAEWHRYRSRVNPEWTIRIDGKVWKPWGKNHAMTLASAGWRKMLCELLKSEVLDYGCDGVFMDTLADLDHPALPEEMRKLELEGLSVLMKELRKRYPQTLLIPNWTIQKTLSVVSPYADAICWEDFSPLHFEDRETERWMRKNAERIGAEQKNG